jgi:7-cyano-7-deazaguanine synthase
MENKTENRAVILLSGGLDSATTLAVAKKEGFELFALSFRYGQRHRRELIAARKVARHLGVREHRILNTDLGTIGESALTGSIPVPKDRIQAHPPDTIPVTYVPARNIIFLSYALAWSETLNAGDIFLGVNAIDYSGYPDCRPEFIRAFEKMAQAGTKAGTEGRLFRIHTPLIRMTKGEIIRTGHRLGVDFSLTWSCYDPQPKGKACGRCDSCLLRKKGFMRAGLTDPIPYCS